MKTTVTLSHKNQETFKGESNSRRQVTGEEPEKSVTFETYCLPDQFHILRKKSLSPREKKKRADKKGEEY